MKVISTILLLITTTFSSSYAASGTSYDVMNMNMIDKKMVNFDGKKASYTVNAGATENIDLTLTDDSLFTGANLYSPSSCPDDEVKFQVLMGDTLLNQFMDWYVAGGINKELAYPAKIPAGLKIRIAYKNTCSNPINVKINYSLHKVLQ